MASYDNILDLLYNSFNKLISDNKSIVDDKEKLLITFLELKSHFSSNFSQCIEDLENVIHLTNINHEAKNSLINENDSHEESPASIKPVLIWPNESYVYSFDKNFRKNTFTINNILPITFTIRVKVIKGSTGSMVIGISKTELNTEKVFLGGDMGESWGIAGNSSLGENGKWTTGKTYKEGDVVTISGNNGIISYHINDDDNSSYQYDMGTSTLYFGVSMHDNQTLELLVD